MGETRFTKTFIMLATFLGLFFFLANTMPPEYLPIETYIETGYPTMFDPATLQSYNFSDYDASVFTFPTYNPDDNTTGTITIGGHEVSISSMDLYEESLLITHKKGWWIFGWHEMVSPQNEFLLTYDVVNAFWNNDTNISSFGVRCEHLELTVLVTYNQTQFDSLLEAFEGHYIYVTVGIGFEESITSGIGIWTLISALLTFQAPNVHILINIALVLPIYSAIAIVIFLAIAEVIPG